MAYEDVFAFFYPALYRLGAWLSMLPAYIAFNKNKKLWVGWLGRPSVFAILLIIILQTRAMSKIKDRLAIFPAVSILALFSKMRTLAFHAPLVEISGIQAVFCAK